MCKRSDPYILKVTIWPIMLLAAGCLWSSSAAAVQARPDQSELFQISFQPVTDTWIAEAYPSSACGDEAYLIAGYDVVSAAHGRIRSLIKFELAGLPAGATITEARLSLYYVFGNGPTTGEYTISAARLTGPWAENSAHWDTAPGIAAGAQSTGTVNHAMPGNWITIDLTEMALGWAQGEYPNYGMALIGPEEISGFSSTEYFGSGDSNNPPRLEIFYQLPEPQGAPAGITTIPVYIPLMLKDFPPVLDLHPIDNDGGEGNYIISWSLHPQGAESYELYEWIDGVWQQIYTASPGETTFNVKDKPTGKYSYFLKATGAWGTGFSVVRSVSVTDTPNQFAFLVIGIGDYGKMPATYSNDARLGNDLKYPIFDATDVQDMLEVYGNPEGQVLALKDRQATKAGIQAAITGWLDAHEAKDTTVLIYFAGHTLVQNNKPYLAPHDLDCAPCTDLSNPFNWVASSGISAEEMNTWLEDLASTHFIFVFDSPGSERWIAELKGTDRTILAGSRSSENRWEFQDIRNGAFSYYFNQAYVEGADQDQDGKISIAEVNNFTVTKTPKLATYVYNHTQDSTGGPFQQHTVLSPGAYSQMGFASVPALQACPDLP